MYPLVFDPDLTPCSVDPDLCDLAGYVPVTSMDFGLFIVDPDYDEMDQAASNKRYGEMTRSAHTQTHTHAIHDSLFDPQLKADTKVPLKRRTKPHTYAHHLPTFLDVVHQVGTARIHTRTHSHASHTVIHFHLITSHWLY